MSVSIGSPPTMVCHCGHWLSIQVLVACKSHIILINVADSDIPGVSFKSLQKFHHVTPVTRGPCKMHQVHPLKEHLWVEAVNKDKGTHHHHVPLSWVPPPERSPDLLWPVFPMTKNVLNVHEHAVDNLVPRHHSVYHNHGREFCIKEYSKPSKSFLYGYSLKNIKWMQKHLRNLKMIYIHIDHSIGITTRTKITITMT